jgi:hypothetical protein
MKKHIAGATVSAIIGAYLTEALLYEKLSEESRNLGTAEEKNSNLEASNNVLQTSLIELKNKHQELGDKFNQLNINHEKATKTNGVIISNGYKTKPTNNKEVAVGSSIEFNVWGRNGNLEIKVVKVTKEGPVVKIDNCSNYHIVSSDYHRTENLHEYFLPIDEHLEIEVYESCCLSSASCDLKHDPERISIAAKSTDIENFTTRLDYKHEIR